MRQKLLNPYESRRGINDLQWRSFTHEFDFPRIVRTRFMHAEFFNWNQSFGLFQSLPLPFRWTKITEALGTRLIERYM